MGLVALIVVLPLAFFYFKHPDEYHGADEPGDHLWRVADYDCS